ncbi:MAG TPA: hypothetical protein VEC39_14840 [Vicinamibacterales bacterium]|nr:hypothetical protein [Vicinamibacterales bacterium]
MRMLMPIGVLLIVLGAGGSLMSCYGGKLIDNSQTETMAGQLDDQTDSAANLGEAKGPRMAMAPISGLLLAIGLVCVGVGMGNWRRPVPSDVRPANPWSDQPREHGDPPVGQV